MPIQRDKVILVNTKDEWMGIDSKENVHARGILHRALSIFIVNSKGELLLQQRAAAKYHSPNLWSNTCCSHPSPGENTSAAARRRLSEELGIVTPLRKVSSFYYRLPVGDSLQEHEYDHIFTGLYDGIPVPDPAEVQAYKWVDMNTLDALLQDAPHQFTAWFLPIYKVWRQLV